MFLIELTKKAQMALIYSSMLNRKLNFMIFKYDVSLACLMFGVFTF